MHGRYPSLFPPVSLPLPPDPVPQNIAVSGTVFVETDIRFFVHPLPEADVCQIAFSEPTFQIAPECIGVRLTPRHQDNPGEEPVGEFEFAQRDIRAAETIDRDGVSFLTLVGFRGRQWANRMNLLKGCAPGKAGEGLVVLRQNGRSKQYREEEQAIQYAGSDKPHDARSAPAGADRLYGREHGVELQLGGRLSIMVQSPTGAIPTMNATENPSSSIRIQLEDDRKTIAQAFRKSRDGRALCASLTMSMDRTMGEAFGMLSPSSQRSLAVLALGGYGRSELFPHSDVDVMILLPAKGAASSAGEAAKEFLHHLWNAGLSVGHSVRTVEEALGQYGVAIDAWISMLECRVICGDQRLYRELSDALQVKIRSSDKKWFITSAFEEATARHGRFGSSVKLLEPNVKKSAGSLRDLHTIFWLYRGCEDRYFDIQDPKIPATFVFLDRLLADGILSEELHRAAVAAGDFLFNVRGAMHIERDSPNETLEYGLQRTVAELLGYSDQAGLRSVEVFMHDYYRHARTIHSLFRLLGERYRERLDPPRRLWNRGRKLGTAFRLREDKLALDESVKGSLNPAQVFEAFALTVENEADLDLGLRTAIEHAVARFPQEQASSPQAQALLRKVFLSPRVAPTLSDMNDTGLLARIIPEFAELVAFFQHNVYHYYTADEHTIIALTNAERLRDATGFLHEVYCALRRKEILFLAILLHDIAKPQGVADHEVTGVPIAKRVVSRIGFQELAEDVAFLVRHHLAMEQIAFRRNLSDPETIKEFAARFENPALLDYLYLLTFADLSAVNPGVWTEWKASMLQELYQRTAEVLRRHLTGEEVDRLHAEKSEEEKEEVIRGLEGQFQADAVRRHLDSIANPAYTSAFSFEEIGRHITLGAGLDVVETRFVAGDGSTDVTVITRDAPYALSKFCAVLSANDASIFTADIFTRDDGIIFDRFRVHDASTGAALTARTCTKVQEDLRNVLTGTLDIDHLFLEHHRKWKRRPKRPANPTTRTDVRFEDTPSFTIIDVYAPDRVGFLFRVTETISALGLNIFFARIATRVDGIVDAFYVRERATGNPIATQDRKDEVQSRIMTTLESMALRELIGE
jgi:[protein-PII] uridylyltransferase